jgi:hypothetical protein
MKNYLELVLYIYLINYAEFLKAFQINIVEFNRVSGLYLSLRHEPI